MAVNPFNGNGNGEGGGGGGGVPSDYDAVKSQVETNRQDIATVSGRVDTLDTTVQNHEMRIVTLELSQSLQDDAIRRNASNVNKFLDYIGGNTYHDIASNQGVRLIGASSAIDTGLTLDGTNEFDIVGCTTDYKQTVLFGGQKSTKARTYLKILGTARKFQSMWAANKELSFDGLEEQINVNRLFRHTQNSTETRIYHNVGAGAGVEFFTIENGGYTGTDANTPLYLFNFSSDAFNVRNIVFQSAKVTHANGEETLFKAQIKRNTATGMEVLCITKNGVELPLNGGYLELVTFQAA